MTAFYHLGGRSQTYTWDADNRLVKITPYTPLSTATTSIQYDGLGRFIKITDDLTSFGGGITEHRFLWCGDELCQSRTASDSVQEHFYEEGIHTLIAGHESTYAIKDHLGSVHKNIGINSQSVYASFYYNPYGGFYRSSQTGTNLDEFRYAGMFYLPEAELYFTRYRAYDPSTGRWLSRDPIEEDGGINLYGYVEGNPVNLVDPLGLAKGDNNKAGKRNLGTEGFTKKSDASDVEEALKDAIKNCQKDRIQVLRGLLKVIKRGGTMIFFVPNLTEELLKEDCSRGNLSSCQSLCEVSPENCETIPPLSCSACN
jgi:RHS repeat-associated protein